MDFSLTKCLEIFSVCFSQLLLKFGCVMKHIYTYYDGSII